MTENIMTLAVDILLVETGVWALLAAAAAVTTWITHPPGRDPDDEGSPSGSAWNSSVFAAGLAILVIASNVYLYTQAAGLLTYSYAIWLLIGQAILATAVVHSWIRALAVYRHEIHSAYTPCWQGTENRQGEGHEGRALLVPEGANR